MNYFWWTFEFTVIIFHEKRLLPQLPILVDWLMYVFISLHPIHRIISICENKHGIFGMIIGNYMVLFFCLSTCCQHNTRGQRREHRGWHSKCLLTDSLPRTKTFIWWCHLVWCSFLLHPDTKYSTLCFKFHRLNALQHILTVRLYHKTILSLAVGTWLDFILKQILHRIL